MALEGQHLGHYRLLRLLGSGGMGEVYLAEDARIGQQVAIKVMRTEGMAYLDPASLREASRLFEREARAIARLDHPNILPLYAYGEEIINDIPLTYLVMPYRKEGTLATWLKRRGSTDLLSPHEVSYLLLQAADALQHAHEQHILHQDVKPSNFLIRTRKNLLPDLLLADFGIAKFTTATASASQSIRGTPTYMAPEQWDGHPVAATDQYAIAIMVYELLTGRPPFQGNLGQIMRQHFQTTPQAPGTLNPDLPRTLDAVILRALAKSPEERFPSVADFAQAFQQAILVPSASSLAETLPVSLPESIDTSATAQGQDGVPTVLDSQQNSHSDHQASPPIAPAESAAGTLLEYERRLVTILFCDLVGFTSLSERLDPEDVREIQSRYFGKMSEEIRNFGGTIEKYVGDAVLAMFGVPVAHEDDAVRAIRCGLSLQAALKSLALDISKQWGVELALRVGVNTGEVVSGRWEVAGRQEYNVSGDAVNTAARLQAAAEPGEVLVGEETRWLARKAIRFGERREVTLKGKAAVVPVYSALEAREGAVAWRPRTPLVDRNDELALLSSIWAKVVREARPHFVMLVGDPGIGKSRLVAEFEARGLHEALVLHGRCLPYGEVLGYWALAEVVKEAAGITSTDDRETTYHKLGDLVAHVIGQTGAAWDPLEITRHLALLSGLDVEVNQPAIADQRALHMSVRHFIEALAHSQPLCILFDDLHWADDALLDLIEFVAAHVRGAPLLMVAQARPELLEKRPVWGRGIRHFTSLSLEPLDEANGHELVVKLCWEHGLSEDVAEDIGHGAAGNPLFAEELVATIAQRGGTTGIPSAIKALISARLDALPPEERRTIQLAAVIGKVFWEGGLHALGVPGDVTTSLEALEQKDLLRSQLRSQFRGDREYAFKHDLIRDVAYEMLSRADRRVLHSRVTAWIEAVSGERVEEYLDLLAYHAVQAGQEDHALDYLIRAAERAERAAAHREEAALLAQTLDIAERTGQRQLVAELRAKRGKAFLTIAMWQEAIHELELALAGLASEQVEQRIQVLIDLAEVRHYLSDAPGTRRYASEALSLVEQVGRDDLAAAATGALALADASDGAIQASLDQFQYAFVRAGKNLPIHLGWIFEHYGLALYWTGNYEAGIERSREAIDSARKSHDTTTIARALGDLGMALTGRGRYDEALQVFAEAWQFAHEYGTGTWLARATAMCGGLHLQLFDFAKAEALAEEAREIGRSANWQQAITSGGIDLLLNYAQRQEPGRTEPLLVEVAEAVMKGQGPHRWLWMLRLAEARAEIALARGEWEEAIGFADDAIAQSVLRGRVKYQVAGMETRAKALAALDRKHEAIAGLRSAVDLARPVGDPAMFLRAAVSLLTLEGNDQLLAEARAIAQRIIAALPDEEMIRRFKAAEPVRTLGPLSP